MCTLYLDRQGAKLGLAAGRFTLEGGEGEHREFPAEQVDRVLLYGRVNLTPAALAGLLERGVPTSLLSSRGRLRGFLAATVGGQVRRRARQYSLMQQPELGLPYARALVTAKLRNQHRLLQGWLHQDAASLKPLVEASKQAPDAATLRGIEGTAARTFFGCFPRLLADSPFTFPGRNKRPPKDPVNALLSLGYTLLLAEMETAVGSYGLDPFAGVFHASDGSQPSCPLDLMEPLRCVVDRLVIRLARHQLHPDDFTNGDQGCRLADGKRGKFYAAWEELLLTSVQWRGKHWTMRQVIHAQAGDFAHHLDHPDRPLQVFSLHDVGRA